MTIRILCIVVALITAVKSLVSDTDYGTFLSANDISQ